MHIRHAHFGNVGLVRCAQPSVFVEKYQSASSDPSLSAKVPLLETDDGDVIIESMVILEYGAQPTPPRVPPRQPRTLEK